MAGCMTLKILVPQAFVKPLIIISIIFISLESALGSRNCTNKASTFKKTSVQSKDVCLLFHNNDVSKI